MPRRLRDDLGREVYFGPPPRRVVSLVPSETFNLCALGLGDRLVGRTRFCVEPATELRDIPVVGGTKDVDVDAVMALEPDLVLANREENARPALEQLASERYRVFVSFPQRVEDAVAHLARLALIFGVGANHRVADLIRRGYREASSEHSAELVSVFVPIWREPWMTFSRHTYAHDVLSKAGFDNVFAERKRSYPLRADLGRATPMSAEQVGERDTRYPRITMEEIVAHAPRAVLLPDEPFAFCVEDKAAFVDAADRVELVSGKDLFWHGAWTIGAVSRLRELAARLKNRG